MNPKSFDLVLIDLISTTEGNQLLAKVLWERKGYWVESYGRVEERNWAEFSIERMADSIAALKQSILSGDTYLEPIYHRAIALAVDTINLRAINSP